MNSTSFASRPLKKLIIAGGLLIAGMAIAGQLQAACTDMARPAALRSQGGLSRAVLIPTVYRPARFILTNFENGRDDERDSAAIVGLWKFEMRVDSDQPPFRKGDLFDYGLATWHDDGTEIMFSGGRPPNAGDVCMGAWRQLGRNRFKLSHIALGLALGGPGVGTYIGPTAIRELVSVDPSGNSYTGSFTLTQYLGTPSSSPWTEFDESVALPVGQGSFSGTIKAVRVSADD
jgi:hypothetical protein